MFEIIVPLEDNVGNILTQGFLMVEELNVHFGSVFTREDRRDSPILDPLRTRHCHVKHSAPRNDFFGQVN